MLVGMRLTTSQTCAHATKKANGVLGSTEQNNASRWGEAILPLCSAPMRPYLVYWVWSWAPHYKRPGATGERHKNKEGTWSTCAMRKAERAGTARPGEQEAQGHLVDVYKCPMGGADEDGGRPCSAAPSARTRGNGHQLEYERVPSEHREALQCRAGGRAAAQLPGGAAGSPGISSGAAWTQPRAHRAGRPAGAGVGQTDPKAPSNPSCVVAPRRPARRFLAPLSRGSSLSSAPGAPQQHLRPTPLSQGSRTAFLVTRCDVICPPAHAETTARKTAAAQRRTALRCSGGPAGPAPQRAPPRQGAAASAPPRRARRRRPQPRGPAPARAAGGWWRPPAAERCCCCSPPSGPAVRAPPAPVSARRGLCSPPRPARGTRGSPPGPGAPRGREAASRSTAGPSRVPPRRARGRAVRWGGAAPGRGWGLPGGWSRGSGSAPGRGSPAGDGGGSWVRHAAMGRERDGGRPSVRCPPRCRSLSRSARPSAPGRVRGRGVRGVPGRCRAARERGHPRSGAGSERGGALRCAPVAALGEQTNGAALLPERRGCVSPGRAPPPPRCCALCSRSTHRAMCLQELLLLFFSFILPFPAAPCVACFLFSSGDFALF